jgi:hypothetical protein
MGMKPEDKAKIVTNLLTLISSETEGTPEEGSMSSHYGHNRY